MATSSTASRAKKAGGAVARSEQNGHFKTIEFQGLTLHLPGTVKLRLLKQLTDGTNEEMIQVVEQLLGEEQMEQVWDLDVDISQGMDNLGVVLGDLSLAVFNSYGTTAGESEASSPPSRNTKGRSRPTSSTTTDSD